MKSFDKQTLATNRKYLELLSRSFPEIRMATAEIINLKAILNLPKGTEHFISDVHGEHAAFEHVLRNCSGSLRRKVEETLSDRLSPERLTELTTLIYYPSEKLSLMQKEGKITDDWYFETILCLIEVCRVAASKYSHSKIRKSFPKDYSYITQELLFESDVKGNRHDYYNQIIKSIIETDAAWDFIINICETIRKLNLDHLHIVGDIYDRGKAPDKVMDILNNSHSLDIQWGNHDILWIGAACGNRACVANVVRISLRYGNTAVLEQAYGINLLPLSIFAMHAYANETEEDMKKFAPKIEDEVPDIDDELLGKMQKAIAIIQFKCEEALIRNNPEFNMDDRLLLSCCDYEKGICTIDGVSYELNSANFPTIDPADPSRLTAEEEAIISALSASFAQSDKLSRHINFMLSEGMIYKTSNNNLMFHAHVPMNEDLSFKCVSIGGKSYCGKALMDKCDEMTRAAYYARENCSDFLWFLWCSPDSPLFGKDKMATFERYFIDDKSTHKESYEPFYHHLENEEMACKILSEFGVDPKSGHIICGHVPVKAVKGENPIKAGGKLICIDGGFSKPYQKETGTAGCTLTYNSYGMNLIIHEPFCSVEEAVKNGLDIKSEIRFVSSLDKRLLVADTDIGLELKEQIYYLEMLLYAYKSGDIAPRK